MIVLIFPFIAFAFVFVFVVVISVSTEWDDITIEHKKLNCIDIYIKINRLLVEI